MTLAGIETATFRFVAEHHNHCATAVPNNNKKELKILEVVKLYMFLLKNPQKSHILDI